jgi:hypothetical protein
VTTRTVLSLSVLWILACSGQPASREPSQASAPAPAEPEVEWTGPQVVVLQRDGDTCTWSLRDLEGHSKTIGQSATCPVDLLWSSAAGRLVARTATEVLTGPWPPSAAPTAVAVPADLVEIWVGPDGSTRGVSLLRADVFVEGGTFVYSGGGETVQVPGDVELDALARYGVKGGTPVAAGEGDRQVELVEGGEERLAVFYQLEGTTWTKLGALPTRFSPMSQTDPAAVGGPWRERATGWFDLRAALADNDGAASAASPDASTAERLGTLVGVGEGEEVGVLPLGDQGVAVFKQIWGDSLHASAPVFLCGEPTCKDPLALDVPTSGTLLLTRMGDRLLVSQEPNGGGARVYAPGRPTPVATFPATAQVAWAGATAEAPAAADGDGPKEVAGGDGKAKGKGGDGKAKGKGKGKGKAKGG